MKRFYYFILLFLIPGFIYAQENILADTVKPGRFDQGKMWTFENAPLDYFEEQYGFRPTEEWLEDVRKSALRFSGWCSASFVSSEGLIMTNHHCSRGVVASVMKEGENFDDNGFYAETLEEERRIPDLYVDQLEKLADITARIKELGDATPEATQKALEQVKNEYAAKEGWSDLELQTVTFYSGGRYSLYGFKRYPDIRLVLYPELALGYYGGDPDNFTYPRYNLDFTFFRAYDENGNPLNPNNYFTFNSEGADKGEVVFVIGNPGSTGRYRTMAQLQYDRDVSAPAVIDLLRNRMEILKNYAEGVTDVYKKDSIINVAFSLSNSNKAYTGRLKGMKDPYLMTKKAKREEELRQNLISEGSDPWSEIEKNVQEMSKIYADVIFLSPNPIRGKINSIMHQLYGYVLAAETGNEEAMAAHKETINELFRNFDRSLEKELFATQLQELKKHSKQGYVDNILKGRKPEKAAEEIMTNSMLFTEKGREKFFNTKPEKLDKLNDPLVAASKIVVPTFRMSAGKMSALNQKNAELEQKIMNMQFELTGPVSPPDATFSLRIADGVVKGYPYNGTLAPYKTTYFGLYDRHYSHDRKEPWDLPKRWLNPPLELLRSPLNFVSTNDIIGGNSGSPIINKNKEVVGLVFDGNIESLPGYFIYDDTYNRTVNVHAGGITAALKYIYKADRLVEELSK